MLLPFAADRAAKTNPDPEQLPAITKYRRKRRKYSPEGSFWRKTPKLCFFPIWEVY